MMKAPNLAEWAPMNKYLWVCENCFEEYHLYEPDYGIERRRQCFGDGSTNVRGKLVYVGELVK